MTLFDRLASRFRSGNSQQKMEQIGDSEVVEAETFPPNLHRFSRAELEIACLEAHTNGRLYANGGEKRLPGDEHRYSMDRVYAAVASYRKSETKRKARSRKQNMVATND